MKSSIAGFAWGWVVLSAALFAAEAQFDLVIRNGLVIDPESGLDAVRHVGIRAGVVQAIAETELTGREVFDATGRVVAPGFIDLHQHAVEPADMALKAQDGVTLVAELEVGAANVDAWYAARKGRMLIHHAVSVGHIPSRLQVMGDRPAFLPPTSSAAATRTATDQEIAAICQVIDTGLKRGAVAVGFGLQYTPAATPWETLEVFRVAARHGAPCHVHMRSKGGTGPANIFSAVEELVAATVITGAPAHVCHVQSTANQFTPRILQLIADARARGLDLTVECYPYTAGMTDIRSSVFDPGWRERGGYDYGDLQWPATGERLTAESFERYRREGGLVILHSNPESVIRESVAHPLTMIASDGLRGHPRHAGSSARVLGRYVRDEKLLSLSQAIEKLALMPARRLEGRVPAMKNKGRIRVGADADLVVFDPATVTDRATYTAPDEPSSGFNLVLVQGVAVVRDGAVQAGVLPGTGVRAPLRD